MKKWLSIVLALALCLTALVGCGPNTPPDTTDGSKDTQAPPSQTSGTEGAPAAKELKFAVLAPITGNYAEFGKAFEVATKMAADEINAEGGVNGRPISLTVYDTKGDATESADIARQLVGQDDIMGVIGDFSSTACMADAPIFGDAGMVLLSPTASHSDFTPMNDYMFSIMGRTDDESRFFISSLVKDYKGADNIGIIYTNSDWGNQCNSSMMDQAAKDGLTVVADEPYTEGEIDFTNVLNKVKNQNPELLVLIMQTVDCANALNAIAQMGWDIDTVCQGASASQQVIELAGENAEGLCSTTSFFIDENVPREKEWLDKFVAGAGFTPTVHAAVAYDAVYIMAEAAKSCGDNVTREGIREGLANLGEYIGFTGPIEFDETGAIFRKVLIVQIENGTYVRRTDYNYGNQ